MPPMRHVRSRPADLTRGANMGLPGLIVNLQNIALQKIESTAKSPGFNRKGVKPL
jgi:hypothetical protein